MPRVSVDWRETAKLGKKLVKEHLDFDVDASLKQAQEIHSDFQTALAGSGSALLERLRNEIESQNIDNALSDTILRQAKDIWQQYGDSPVGRLLLSRYQGTFERVARQQLLEHLSQSSIDSAQELLNLYTNVALHLQEQAQQQGKGPQTAMQEITAQVCALEEAAATAWSRFFVRVTPEYYREYVNQALAVHAGPRLALSVAAAVLHGLDPRQDEFVAALIIAYSAGHIAQDMAGNMVAFFERVVAPGTGSSSIQSPDAARENQMASVASRLLTSTTDCSSVGSGVWHLFDMAATDSADSSSSRRATAAAADAHTQQQQQLPHPRWGMRERAALLGLKVAKYEGQHLGVAVLEATAGLIMVFTTVTVLLAWRCCGGARRGRRRRQQQQRQQQQQQQHSKAD